MGEERIRELGELNDIIEFYSERILEYNKRIGETTIYKEVVTETLINTLKSRMHQLMRKRDKLEYEIIESLQDVVYA